MDEFGDRTVTETHDTGISSPDEIELEERHSSNTEPIDSDEFPWAGRSLGEMESTPPVVDSQNSGKHPSFTIFDFCNHHRLQGRLRKFEEMRKRIYCCCGAVTVRLGQCTGTGSIRR